MIGPEHEIAALQAALAGRARLQDWSRGAELIALLRAVARAGWLDALAAGTSPDAVAAVGGPAGVGVDRVRADVLVVAGVVVRDDASGRLDLGAEFGALHRGASGVTLPVVLAALDADRTRTRSALGSDTDTGAGPGSDALVVARNWGVLPTTAARFWTSAAGSVAPCSPPSPCSPLAGRSGSRSPRTSSPSFRTAPRPPGSETASTSGGPTPVTCRTGTPSR